MKTQNTQSVNKMISFSNTLYGFAMEQANKKGITFQEYMRYLVVKEKEEEDEEVYALTAEEDDAVTEGLEDYKKGRYVVINSKADLDAEMDTLDNEV